MPHKVNQNTCIGCGACVSVCPVSCITLIDVEIEDKDGKKIKKTVAHVDQSKCIDCGACESVCPTGAIAPDPDYGKVKDTDNTAN